MPRKTLNDHLFDQLERLAEADESTIETEMNKANSIIAISEQMLNVARLKLEIINAGAGTISQFTEIDNNNVPALQQDGEGEKKN